MNLFYYSLVVFFYYEVDQVYIHTWFDLHPEALF